ncbi:MAG: glycosyltransferase family 4 protein [Pyrobaculum sp.]
MKVAVVVEKLWPEGSGAELATSLLLREIISMGVDVVVYTGTRRPLWLPENSVRYLPILNVGLGGPKTLAKLYTNLFRHGKFFEKALRDVDVVYIPHVSYPVIPLAKKLKKKVVVHLHDSRPASQAPLLSYGEAMNEMKRTFIYVKESYGVPTALIASIAAPILTRIMRKWISMADLVVCVSKRQEELITKFVPELRDKTAVVYNILHDLPSVERRLSDTPTFLYKGGDYFHKGFHVLLTALERLCNENIKVVFTNRYRERSVKAVEHIKNRCRLDVEIVGKVEFNKILKLQMASWGVLFPSIWEEPLPYSVVEAAAMGVLPIASRVGGVPEILEGTPGEHFLVEPNCPNCIAEKIRDVAQMDKGELLEIGEKLKQVRERFDRGNAQKFMKLLELLVVK